jgi:hypothetical protein
MWIPIDGRDSGNRDQWTAALSGLHLYLKMEAWSHMHVCLNKWGSRCSCVESEMHIVCPPYRTPRGVVYIHQESSDFKESLDQYCLNGNANVNVLEWFCLHVSDFGSWLAVLYSC